MATFGVRYVGSEVPEVGLGDAAPLALFAK
jgi:hypothetical protein